ncbi:hypothetical protein KIPB_014115, partial [Kipferlia bialata]
TTSRPYVFNKASHKPILFRLRLVLGRGKGGVIAVREGDDPHTLARNFSRTFNLNAAMHTEVIASIQEQLTLYYLELEEMNAGQEALQ